MEQHQVLFCDGEVVLVAGCSTMRTCVPRGKQVLQEAASEGKEEKRMGVHVRI